MIADKWAGEYLAELHKLQAEALTECRGHQAKDYSMGRFDGLYQAIRTLELYVGRRDLTDRIDTQRHGPSGHRSDILPGMAAHPERGRPSESACVDYVD